MDDADGTPDPLRQHELESLRGNLREATDLSESLQRDARRAATELDEARDEFARWDSMFAEHPPWTSNLIGFLYATVFRLSLPFAPREERGTGIAEPLVGILPMSTSRSYGACSSCLLLLCSPRRFLQFLSMFC